jgi:hypothetical protein
MRIHQVRNADAIDRITPLAEDLREGMESHDVKRTRAVLTAANQPSRERGRYADVVPIPSPARGIKLKNFGPANSGSGNVSDG